MEYLGLTAQSLKEKGAIHTAREISQQPQLWQKVWDQVERERVSIIDFLQAVKGFNRIILTGAGTSAFIGMSLRGVFQRTTGVCTEAISSTDLVSHPKDFFLEDQPTLLISFARSGNSPESVAAVVLADELCRDCTHIFITCNGEGRLANHVTRGKKYVFALPEEANDKSLAMTSSYSAMLLAGKLIAHINTLDEKKKDVQSIIKYAEKTIAHQVEEIRHIASLDFKRAVFLGSGPFFGTATESQLKLQELTDGKVICKSDSFLGFRHGPKAVIDGTTLVVYVFSNNNYSQRYERDLVMSMKKGSEPLAEVSISELPSDDLGIEYQLTFSENGYAVDEEFLTISSIVPAQLLGFFKSLHLGLHPDAPSASGAITRVVEGVKIYSMK